MFQQLDLSNNHLAQAVYQIQKAAYQIEAELLGTAEIPPLQESFEGLQKVDETFIGFYQASRLLGVISYKVADQIIDIYRLFIHPDVLRQGVGRKLIDYVVSQNLECRKMIVATGEKNYPAVKFYRSYGFETESKTILSENLTVIHFSKDLLK